MRRQNPNEKRIDMLRRLTAEARSNLDDEAERKASRTHFDLLRAAESSAAAGRDSIGHRPGIGAFEPDGKPGRVVAKLVAKLEADGFTCKLTPPSTDENCDPTDPVLVVSWGVA